MLSISAFNCCLCGVCESVCSVLSDQQRCSHVVGEASSRAPGNQGMSVGGLLSPASIEPQARLSPRDNRPLARAVATSRRSTPNAHTRRRMPLQARKPCSGWAGVPEGVRKRGGCRPDASRLPADTIDGPVGITSVAGWHVFSPQSP